MYDRKKNRSAQNVTDLYFFVVNGIAESSWLTDYYNNSCRYKLCDDHDARAMFTCFEVLILLLLLSGVRFQVGSLG